MSLNQNLRDLYNYTWWQSWDFYSIITSLDEVKRVGDNLLGVCTQCIVIKSAIKYNTSTIIYAICV